MEDIFFNGFGSVVVLRPADEAAIVNETTQDGELVGTFKLAICGAESVKKDLGSGQERVWVTRIPGGLAVKRALLQSFIFAPPICLDAHTGKERGDGPWLWTNVAEIEQTDITDFAPAIALNTATISLVQNIVYSPPEPKFVYPIENGHDAKFLLKSLFNSKRPKPGLFLRATDESVVFEALGLNQFALLNHFKEAGLEITPHCKIHFPLGPVAGEVKKNFGLRFQWPSTEPAQVQAAQTAGLQLQNEAVLGQRFTWLGIAEASVSAGVLAATKWHIKDDETEIAMFEPGDAAMTSLYALRTPNSRLRFNLPLPGNPLTEAQNVPHFLYRDASVDNGSPLKTRRERFYGIRVPALSSTRGSSTVLDSNWARIALEPKQRVVGVKVEADQSSINFSMAPASKKFVLRAGCPFDAPGKDSDSVLFPKPAFSTAADGIVPVRELELPIQAMSLRVVAPLSAKSAKSPISINTSLPEPLTLDAPVLVGPPLGTSAVSGAKDASSGGETNTGYARWSLRRSDTVSFLLTKSFIVPKEGANWLQPFATEPGVFRRLEHPGAAIEFKRGFSVSGLDDSPKTSVETKIGANGKELVVYSGVVASLSFLAVDYAQTATNRGLNDKQILFKTGKLKDEAVKKWVKRNEGIDDLVIVFFEQDGSDPGQQSADAAFKTFIDDNRPNETQLTDFVWPFFSVVAIPLWRKRNDDHGGIGEQFCPEIARHRSTATKKFRPGLAFDFSSVSAFEPGLLGWSSDDWTRFAAESPMLWPRKRVGADGSAGARPNPGARLDPSDRFWNGILLRDVPLVFDVPDDIRRSLQNFKALEGLYDSINEHLMVSYGWKDENGATWDASLGIEAAIDFTPKNWDSSLFKFELLDFRSTGAANAPVSAEGRIRVTLGFIQVGQENHKHGMRLTGRAAMNLLHGATFDRLELAPEEDDWASDSVPGFNKVIVKRLSTDFQSGEIDLELFPDDELKHALPFLDSGEPIKAFAVLNFKGPPELVITLQLPAEQHTNLFGKWPMTIQGLQLQIGSKTNNLRIRCRLNLGAGDFLSAGATVILGHIDDASGQRSWSLDVELDEISGKFGVGELNVSLTLGWGRADSRAALPKYGVASGTGRDFYGRLKLSKSPVFGDNTELDVRIGSQGEISFWVAAIRTGLTLNFGFGKLEEPGLVLAHNADFDGNLADVLAKVDSQDSMNAIRLAHADEKGQEEWLSKWSPSSRIGTLIAGSGYLNIHPEIASTPEANPRNLTAIAFTSSGLVRINAQSKLFKSVVVNFGLFLDLSPDHPKMTAAFQLPEFKYGVFSIKGGLLEFGLGLHGNTYFLMSLGWPPLKDGSDVERDWSKSVLIHWDGAFPLNTFWGGMRTEYNPPQGRLFFGFALRAGWTWSYAIGGTAIGGSAELGLAVGGVVGFTFLWSDQLLALSDHTTPSSVLVLPRLVDVLETASEILPEFGLDSQSMLIIEAAADHIETILPTLRGLDVKWSITLYADVWGRAEAHVFGVPIVSINIEARARFHICGGVPSVETCQAIVGLTLHVKILCVDVSASAEIDLYLKHGQCEPEPLYSFSQPPL